MDSWSGWERNPVTLNKYLYANADPVNHTDPSGNLALFTQMQAIQVQSALTLVGYAHLSFIGGGSGPEAATGLQCANRVIQSNMGVDIPARNDQERTCDENLNQMRLQLQQGSTETWSTVRKNGSNKGVTVRQMQGALRQLMNERIDIVWFPESLDRWLGNSVIQISKTLNTFPAYGGVARNGTLESLKRETWLKKKEYRIEIENLRGHNLRHIE